MSGKSCCVAAVKGSASGALNTAARAHGDRPQRHTLPRRELVTIPLSSWMSKFMAPVNYVGNKAGCPHRRGTENLESKFKLGRKCSRTMIAKNAAVLSTLQPRSHKLAEYHYVKTDYPHTA